MNKTINGLQDHGTTSRSEWYKPRLFAFGLKKNCGWLIKYGTISISDNGPRFSTNIFINLNNS
jgi:hypothetical protein